MSTATIEKIRQLLENGENISVEFKESRTGLPESVYETVCSFLNRCGGEIILGVNNDGVVVGVYESVIEQLKVNFVTALNNTQFLLPTYYLSIETIEIDNKKILYVFVPESSQVHKCRNRIYDRNEDGDIDITDNNNLVADLYQRKQTKYSENEIISHITIDNLNSELIDRLRKMAVNNRPNHAWKELDNLELLKSAGLYRVDYRTGNEGFTIAAVLLCGKDEVILSVLPHHRTDAILRKVNLDRYDDRDDIRTNLVDSFERLLAFGQKHLPDPFYEEGGQRVSARDKIIRELASNVLIHREYRTAFPAKFILEKDRIYVENSNIPHGTGNIDLNNFTPYPKNPVIARVFKEIGLAEELGSGTRNLIKYGKLFSDKPVELIENDIFKTVVYVSDQASDQDTDYVSDQDTDHAEKQKLVLEYCKKPKSREEIQNHLKMKHKQYFRDNILNPLIDEGLLELTIPDKPKSPKQKYKTVQSSNK